MFKIQHACLDIDAVRRISECAAFPMFSIDILNKYVCASIPPFRCPLRNISEFRGKGFEISLTHILKPKKN